MLLIMVWWFISAHKWFKGPVINVCARIVFDVFRANGSQVEHHMIGRVPDLQGMEQDSGSGSETPATNNKAVEAGGKETIAELKD